MSSVPWCYGIPDRPGLPWLRVLASRLLGRSHLYPVGDSTATAEAALGLGTSLYWSIGTSNNIYVGPTGSFCEPSAFIEQPHTLGQMTPFDSGGLYYGYIETIPALEAHERPLYLDENTYSLHGWRARFLHSITDHWAGKPADYVVGERPSPGLTSRSHDVASNTCPAWLWESRVPLSESYEKEVEVVRLFWRPQEKALFELHINTTSTLSVDEAEQLTLRLGAIAVETDNPVLTMQAQLINEAVTW